MNDAKTGDWLATQQAMLKNFLPWMAQGAAAVHEANAPPLEEQFNELRDTWQASVERWSAFAKEAAQGELPSGDKLREMFTPASWTGPGAGVLDASLQHVLEGPRYATLGDLDRKLLELQQATLQRDKAVAQYQTVVQQAWGRAFERFTKNLASEPQAAGQQTWRGLVDRWLAVANDTLIEAHRSDEFVEAQRRMLRAASDRHLQERRIAEAWCEAAHVPTRSEVDELQRQVTELRRELRLLRRAAQSAAAPTPAPAQPSRKPAVRSRARPAAKPAAGPAPKPATAKRTR
jgi:polyhydroxyalkanoate synthesis regulator phasin